MSGKYHGNNIKNIPEANIMQTWLLRNNVSKSDIIVENKSKYTAENIFNVNEILKKLTNIKNITLITSDWHIKRVKVLSKIMNRKIKFIGVKTNKPSSWLINRKVNENRYLEKYNLTIKKI